MEVKELSAISSDEIISILKEEIKNYDVISRDQEVGTVISVGDGIASVYGIDHAMYGEIVTLETGLKGMVQDIKENEISCILFGDDSEIKQGTKVCRTGKKAGIPVGEGYIGRIVDALGAPIDGKGEIKADGYRPVENEAPGIVDRKSVSVPLETGILSIDSMFPIGRGQRELIIGDRQTGKTSIATDTIINQKGKDVICIYVAIGQKASTVARLVNDLKAHDALDYTTVFCSTASECAPLQYIVPYSATALAEYFMYQGKDVLIVYDDLSKHAVAYRAISLLLGRSPGREAYPGDVFYLHSRLLERSRKGAKTGIHVYTCANVTMDMEGDELTDMEALAKAGAVGFTDDGKPLLDAKIARKAMQEAARVHKPISFHEENPAYIQNNGVNAGKASEYFGIGGSDRQAEIDMVRRDLSIALETGAEIVIQHISAAEAVELVRQAKKKSTKIHAEATPHHFTLTEDAVIAYGTMAKMNPPLRTEADRQAIIRGLQDGTIDLIATDHAPHADYEKAKPLTEAPSGIIGLETSLALGNEVLVDTGELTMMQLLTCMTINPAKLYRLDAGYLAENGPADLVLFDPAKEWVPERFYSKSQNSPFLGQKLKGKVEYTICKGKVIFEA